MTEYRFFPEGTVPHVSTPEFHAHRERAPHLEQPVHQPRLKLAEEFIWDAFAKLAVAHPDRYITLSDLGCGDGGLLSRLAGAPFERLNAHGYDFQPSNEAGWKERGVVAEQADVFGADRDMIDLGDISVCTEVLEHVADPHGVVRWIGETSRFLVASSPWNETPASHDECHAWGFDQDGYRALLEQGGYKAIRHETAGQFQVILGEKR